MDSSLDCWVSGGRYQIIGSTCYDSVGLDLAALLEFFPSLRWDGWRIFWDLNFISIWSLYVWCQREELWYLPRLIRAAPSFDLGCSLLWHFYPLADPSSRFSRPCDECRGRGERENTAGSSRFGEDCRLNTRQSDRLGEFPRGMQTSMAGWLSAAIQSNLGNLWLELWV